MVDKCSLCGADLTKLGDCTNKRCDVYHYGCPAWPNCDVVPEGCLREDCGCDEVIGHRG